MNDDGTLNLKGVQSGNAWDGLKWACDVSRLSVLTRNGSTVDDYITPRLYPNQ